MAKTILVTNFENDIIGYDYESSLKAYEVTCWKVFFMKQFIRRI